VLSVIEAAPLARGRPNRASRKSAKVSPRWIGTHIDEVRSYIQTLLSNFNRRKKKLVANHRYTLPLAVTLLNARR